MKYNLMNISIETIRQNDQKMLSAARKLFLEYFLNLYKDLSSNEIGIVQTTEEYLNVIFDKTEQALKDNILQAYGAFENNILIGLSTFNPLEDKSTLLIRTIPVNVDYNARELIIRNILIQNIRKTHPNTKKIIMMVRKSNIRHQNLCLLQGFKKSTAIFESSLYINQTYDPQMYLAFLLEL